MNRNRSIKMRVISDPCIAAWDYARDAHWIYIGNKRRRVTRVRCKSPDAGYKERPLRRDPLLRRRQIKQASGVVCDSGGRGS